MSEPGQFDLILISDSGKLYHVKMKTEGDSHEPESVEPLGAAYKAVPLYLRDEGATLAIMPDAPSGGGCTCTLLNLQNIKDAIKPPADPNFEAVMKARAILRKGGTITLAGPDGDTQQFTGKVRPPVV